MTSSTRDRLLDAGQRLFAERGFEGTSIGDVEEAAGRYALSRHGYELSPNPN